MTLKDRWYMSRSMLLALSMMACGASSKLAMRRVRRRYHAELEA